MTKFSKIILFLSLLLLTGQLISIIFIGRAEAAGHIAFQLFENILMIAVTFLPAWLGRKTHVRIPKSMEIAFVGFCFASLIMGDLLDFYGNFPWWDMVLHGISGIMLGILAYAAIYALVPDGNISPWFTALWIICFALAAGAMWEIWEYATDGIFGLNSQEYMISSGTFDDSTPLHGREALKDTMHDLILDFVGAVMISIWALLDRTRPARRLQDGRKIRIFARGKHKVFLEK